MMASRTKIPGSKRARNAEVVDLASERTPREKLLLQLRVQADLWAGRAQFQLDPDAQEEAAAIARTLQATYTAARLSDGAALKALEKVSRPQLRRRGIKAHWGKDPLTERHEQIDAQIAFIQGLLDARWPVNAIAFFAVISVINTGELRARMRRKGMESPMMIDPTGEQFTTWVSNVKRRFERLEAIEDFDAEHWFTASLIELGFTKNERDTLLSYRRQHRKKRD